MIENVIETTENCRYCLMCRHVAPVGLVTHLETLTPHGVALTVASQRRGLLEWDEDSVAVAYAEEDGGNCRAHCVTDQPLPAAMAAVRAEIVAAGKAPAAVYEAHERMERWQTPFAEKAPEVQTDQGDVALFVGDETPYLGEGTLEAAVKLLKATGVEVVTIGHGQSSGFLATTLGFPATAHSQAEAILAQLQDTGAGRLLVLNPGDYFTLRQMYDERLGIDFPSDVTLTEVTSLLAEALTGDRLSVRPSEDTAPYAYVDPTHAVRVPERHDAPRALAAALFPDAPARELFWRRERAHPVGSTGLQFGRPDVAEMLTRARLEDARDSGAELLLCEDAATLHHLNRYAAEYGVRTANLYQLLANHLV